VAAPSCLARPFLRTGDLRVTARDARGRRDHPRFHLAFHASARPASSNGVIRTYEPETYRAEIEAIEKEGALHALREHHRGMFLEMMLSRATENFLTYVTELLTLVFRTRPETLRTSETVRLDAILKHVNMEDLIHELAERRVNQLSYQGMRDLAT
jgi:hypothetical protein